MDQYAIYLRKSREDIEAEMHGEGETLKRHETLLLETAKRNRYTVSEIYREVVSGDTISGRPEMMRLLSDVAAGRWKGVLVAEISRLARGNSADQGLVSETFANTETLIVTPGEIINPAEDAGEDRLDMGLFMSRWEYKSIKRRLTRGRNASLAEGKYIGGNTPYGYRRVKLQQQKGWTLESIPAEAEIIREIYDLYLKREPIHHIAERLNQLGVPTRKGGPWTDGVIRRILQNPTYEGKVWWGQRNQGKREKKDPVIYDGLHEPIIAPGVFDTTQALFGDKAVPPTNSLQNPLSGVVRCALCGATMIRQPDSRHERRDQLRCRTRGCQNVGSCLEDVESALIDALQSWLINHQIEVSGALQELSLNDEKESMVAAIDCKEKELASLKKQLDTTYELLEKGIYTTDVFLERNNKLSGAISQIDTALRDLQKSLSMTDQVKEQQELIIPKIQSVIENYRQIEDPVARNEMLREILEKVEYFKSKNYEYPCDFTLSVFPRVRCIYP